MVDEIRVLRLLRSLSEDLQALRDASGAEQGSGGPMWMPGVKYTFVTAIESCIDVAQHICAAEGWGPPRDNGHALQLLGQHRVLTPDLAARMRQSVGFRNVLVHDYLDVDDAIVLGRLHDHADLHDYARQVAGWLASTP